jgi:hypothetical protein
MLFSWPDRIREAFSCHAVSASATLAKYFMPIHLLAVLLRVLEARNEHLAQMYRSGRTEFRSKEVAMVAIVEACYCIELWKRIELA